MQFIIDYEKMRSILNKCSRLISHLAFPIVDYFSHPNTTRK